MLVVSPAMPATTGKTAEPAAPAAWAEPPEPTGTSLKATKGSPAHPERGAVAMAAAKMACKLEVGDKQSFMPFASASVEPTT